MTKPTAPVPPFSLAYDLVVSGQTPAAVVAEWLADPLFRRFYEKNAQKRKSMS